MNALLLLFVIGVVGVALAVDFGVIVAWLRKYWRG